MELARERVKEYVVLRYKCSLPSWVQRAHHWL
jgi:hypothetical protein